MYVNEGRDASGTASQCEEIGTLKKTAFTV